MNGILPAAVAASLAFTGCARPQPGAAIAPESAPSAPRAAPSATASASSPPRASASASASTSADAAPRVNGGPERAWTSCGAASGAPKTSYASLREVDWCNREYIPGIATLRKGRAELHDYVESGGLHDTEIFRLGSVAYGDLDGDGADEAVIVLDQESYAAKGGQHAEALVYVFALRGGKVVAVASASAHPWSVARVAGQRVRLDYQPAAQRCTLELRLEGAKLLKGPDPCVEFK